MTYHARLSPSSSERWLHCPASAAVAAQYPQTSSIYADEGTAAHEIAARCLRRMCKADKFKGQTIEVPSRDGSEPNTFIVDDEMIEMVDDYVLRTLAWADDARGYAADIPRGEGELFVEVELPISDITGEQGASGTSDSCIVLQQGDVTCLVVRDLKYGRGVRVDAVENTQLLIYGGAAMLALEAFGYEFDDLSPVWLEIDQPRVACGQSSWCLTAGELRKRLDVVRRMAKVALVTPAYGKRVAGEWCRWCPARAECETLAKLATEQALEGLENLDDKDAPVIDHSKLPQYLSLVPIVRLWMNAVEEKAMDRLQHGHPIEGYKLVQGRAGNRAWIDDAAKAAAVTTLVSHGANADDLYTKPELRSPAQCEKLIPKAARQFLAPFTKQPEGKPTVVPASDARPEYRGASADGFENLSESE